MFIFAFKDSIRTFNGCYIIDKSSWQVLNEIPLENGLYLLKLGSDPPNQAFATITINLQKNHALEWHGRNGHLGIDRYNKRSHAVPSVPRFDVNSLKCIKCLPFLRGKARCAPLSSIDYQTSQKLQLIHIDTSGPVPPSFAGNCYTWSILDDYTSKSDVFLLKNKDETAHKVEWYRNCSHTELNQRLTLSNIQLGRAEENRS